MSTRFYYGQKDYIAQLNAMDDIATSSASSAAASAAAAASTLANVVHTDTATQGLTSTQQANARTNISAAPVNSPTFTGTVTMNGTTLTYGSTGQRITADFSNGTLASRLMFQTSTTNSFTSLGALPSGAGSTSQFNFFNSSDTTNAAYLAVGQSSTSAFLNAKNVGTGVLKPISFQFNGAEVAQFDTNGNLGISTAPKGGASGFNFIELGSGSYMTQVSNGNSYIGKNWYFNGSAYKYKTANKALQYVQDDNGHAWQYAASGTADATITWTSGMQLDNSGNLLIATATPRGKITVDASTSVSGPGLSVTGHTSSNVASDIEINRSSTSALVGQGCGLQFNDSGTTTNSWLLQAGAGNLQFFGYAGGSWGEKARFDNSGNLLIGTTSANGAALNFGSTKGINSVSGRPTLRMYDDGTYSYGIASGANGLELSSNYTLGDMRFFTGGTTASPVERMRIDSGGNLLVGATSGSWNRIFKSSAEGNAILEVRSSLLNNGGFAVYAVNATGENAAACTVSISKNSSNGRSINSAGTNNALGNDYAEYMTKADGCGVIAKGQIVGINEEGRLTDKWAEAVSFLIKTTNPSFVGGDNWGTEDSIGMKRPTDTEADDYQERLEAFNEAVEVARQKVDRIAYCGQVPVNVIDAVPGQYVVPVQDGEGIKGILMNEDDMTLKQYMKAVGIVQNILPDGRANVRVKPV
jgi:hypothetical protein